jgi:Ser-tRNA(Ala) deacylase AlaX
MEKNNGRLQTAEHILAKIIENNYPVNRVGIAKFTEEEGILEIYTETNLRKENKEDLENQVNNIIKQNLKVSKTIHTREEAVKLANLSKVNENIKEIRLVKIEDFDLRPCKDPHVDNTSEIGILKILKIKKAGSGRYRFTITVE